jgi:hypothetical protein
MTTHNLDQHLSWLLQHAPSLQPAAAASTHPIIVSDEGDFDNDVLEAAISFEQPSNAENTVPQTHNPRPGFNVAESSQQEGGGTENMGRLSFAPRPTTKPRMLSQIVPTKLNSLGGSKPDDGNNGPGREEGDGWHQGGSESENMSGLTYTHRSS